MLREFASPPRPVCFEFPAVSPATGTAPLETHFNGIDEVNAFFAPVSGAAASPPAAPATATAAAPASSTRPASTPGPVPVPVSKTTPAATVTAADSVRRLWVMESVDPASISELGKALDVDPRIWMRHQRITLWEKPQRDAGNAQVLPSLLSQQQGFTLSYCQPMYLNYVPQAFTTRCTGNERHAALTRTIWQEDKDETFDGVAIVRTLKSTHSSFAFYSVRLG
jgi:hypothetical protein